MEYAISFHPSASVLVQVDSNECFGPSRTETMLHYDVQHTTDTLLSSLSYPALMRYNPGQNSGGYEAILSSRFTTASVNLIRHSVVLEADMRMLDSATDKQ
eukprot:9467357-Pyramimonas_sp.AAC.2